MEIILVVIISIALSLCLGFGYESIMLIIVAFVLLFIFVMFILFAYSLVRMLSSKRFKAEFSRIDKNPSLNFKSTYYLVDGTEYPTAFPSEIVMKNQLYSNKKKYTVFLNKKTNRVYDKYGAATCILGFIFSAAVIIAVAVAFFTTDPEIIDDLSILLS